MKHEKERKRKSQGLSCIFNKLYLLFAVLFSILSYSLTLFLRKKISSQWKHIADEQKEWLMLGNRQVY